MKQLFIILLCMCTTNIAWANEPDKRVIIDSVVNKYKELNTFSCEGKMVEERTSSSSEHKDVSETVFSVRYERNGQLKIDWKQLYPQWNDADRFASLFSKDKKYYFATYEGSKRLNERINEYPAHDEMKNFTRPIPFAFFLLGFLNGDFRFFRHDVVYVGEVVIGGRNCALLSFDMTGDFYNWAMWVDMETFLIRKMEKRRSLPQSALERIKPGEEENISLPRMIFYTQTIEFTNIVIDQPIPVEDFIYLEKNTSN